MTSGALLTSSTDVTPLKRGRPDLVVFLWASFGWVGSSS
jgi:hypothetical protein